VIVPELVVHRWWDALLHNQRAFLLKARLLLRKGNRRDVDTDSHRLNTAREPSSSCPAEVE
jgi:hypothetical protein